MLNPKLKQIARELEDFIDETELHEDDVKLISKIITAIKSIKVEQNETKVLSNIRIIQILVKAGKTDVKYKFEYAANNQVYHFLGDTKSINPLELVEGGLYHISTVKKNTGWSWISAEFLGNGFDEFY